LYYSYRSSGNNKITIKSNFLKVILIADFKKSKYSADNINQSISSND